MNRRDVGYVLTGLLGAVAGTGCASPMQSEALPVKPASGRAGTSACTDSPIVIPVDLREGFWTFRLIGGPYTITDPTDNVSVHANGDTLLLIAKNKFPHTEIVVTDDATKAILKFRIFYC